MWKKKKKKKPPKLVIPLPTSHFGPSTLFLLWFPLFRKNYKKKTPWAAKERNPTSPAMSPTPTQNGAVLFRHILPFPSKTLRRLNQLRRRHWWLLGCRWAALYWTSRPGSKSMGPSHGSESIKMGLGSSHSVPNHPQIPPLPPHSTPPSAYHSTPTAYKWGGQVKLREERLKREEREGICQSCWRGRCLWADMGGETGWVQPLSTLIALIALIARYWIPLWSPEKSLPMMIFCSKS